MRKRLFLFFLLPFTLLARDAGEQQRIDYLIDSLGSLKNAVFIRNGKEYDAPAACDHLRSKLNVAGDRVKTAEQFIKYCATQSSMSHQPYKIRFADGAEKETAVYFGDQLKEFDAKRR